MAPENAIPSEMPTCRSVAISADAEPSRFRSTAPMMVLLLGGLKGAPAQTQQNQDKDDCGNFRLKGQTQACRKRRRQWRPAPNIGRPKRVRKRSDSAPLMGLVIMVTMETTAMRRPDFRGERLMPSIR